MSTPPPNDPDTATPVETYPETGDVTYLTGDADDWETDSGENYPIDLGDSIRVALPVDDAMVNYYVGHDAFTAGQTVDMYIRVENLVGSFMLAVFNTSDGIVEDDQGNSYQTLPIVQDGVYRLSFVTAGDASETLQINTYETGEAAYFDLTLAISVGN